MLKKSYIASHFFSKIDKSICVIISALCIGLCQQCNASRNDKVKVIQRVHDENMFERDLTGL
jgi:hypothetical protein